MPNQLDSIMSSLGFGNVGTQPTGPPLDARSSLGGNSFAAWVKSIGLDPTRLDEETTRKLMAMFVQMQGAKNQQWWDERNRNTTPVGSHGRG